MIVQIVPKCGNMKAKRHARAYANYSSEKVDEVEKQRLGILGDEIHIS